MSKHTSSNLIGKKPTNQDVTSVISSRGEMRDIISQGSTRDIVKLNLPGSVEIDRTMSPTAKAKAIKEYEKHAR